jgi:PAS domain S-box-containing protein
MVNCFKRYIIVFVWFVLYSMHILGQEQTIKFKRLTADDGLGQNWIRSICQDHVGFMWFGMGGNGVCRYDGHVFKLYKNDPRNKKSLSNNWINTIYSDRNNRLWVGTQFGLNLYDKERDRFEPFPVLQSEFISGMYDSDDGKLYVVTPLNIFEINFEKKTASPFCILSYRCFPDNFTKTFVIDMKGNLWLGSMNGIYSIDIKNKTFTAFRHNDNDPKSISDNVMQSVYSDSEGRVWIGTVRKGLCLIRYDNGNPSQPYFQNFTHDPNNSNSISDGTIRAILDDGNGRLWIGLENGGLDILNLKSLKKGNAVFRHYRNNIFDETSISNNSIYSIFKDNQGTIWIGTYGGGANYYNKLLYKFEHRKQIPNLENCLSNNSVNAFLEEGDNLLIGTEGGLNIFNKKTGLYKVLTFNPDNPSSIGSNAVEVIFKDSRDNIWIGTWAGGLNLYDRVSQTFTRFLNNKSNPKSISNNNIFGIAEDKKGYLWIATMGGGLNRYDPGTNEFKAFRADFDKQNSLSGDWIQAILESSNHELWVSTSNGVDLFNKETETITNFRYDTANIRSISFNGANVIFEDSKKNIWLGTDGGLNLFVRKDSSFIYFRDENGLPDNSIKGICEDNQGNIWITTNNGVSKFINGIHNPEKPVIRNYSKGDGLQGNEFNKRSIYKTKDGTIYFGGANGYNFFHPEQIQDNPFIPKVVISNLLVFNKPVEIGAKNSPLLKQLSESKKIILAHQLNVFTIEFTALNYIAGEENQYAFKLEGFEENWNYVGHQKRATYTNLDPGSYIFRVKAANNDNIWNDEGASIHIVVLPPWWKTWWFKLTEVLCIVMFIFLLVIRIINRFRRLANQTIFDERNQLKTLINNIPDQVFIKDTKLRFLVINDSAVKYMGGRHESEFLHKTDYDVYRKELGELFFNQEQKIIATGISILNEESKRIQDGKESYYSTTKCPIINSNGEIIGLVGFVRDITKQKEAELEILKQSDELQNYNDILSETNVLLEERQQQIEEQSEELRVHSENLTDINKLLVNKQQLILKQTEQLQEKNEQLSILNATKDKFFSIIAHDLRNPFNVVTGFTDILLKRFDKLPPEKIKKYHEIINVSSKSGNYLLENLLQWSRSQTGSIAYFPSKTDLLAVTEETLALLEGDAERKSISIQQLIDPNIIVFADENMVRTIFRNLISNAIKFSNEKGIITINFAILGQMVEITVADTGVGIPPDSLKLLFRVDTTITTKGTAKETGTGLGLILCREFVEKHNGKIWVESEVGKGSAFKFTLPLA